MRPVVAAVADDPGGANALVPVLRALVDDGLVTVRVAALPGARIVFEREGIASSAIAADEVEQEGPGLLAGADLLLTGTSGYGDAEARLRRLAASRGVPAVAVLDFWSAYRERFTVAGGELEEPEAIFVMDEVAGADMVAAGFDAGRLVVSGHPAHDRLVAGRRRFPLLAAPAPGAPVAVLFLSQPWIRLTGGDPAHRLHPGYDEVGVLSLVVAALDEVGGVRDSQVVLTVRRHPREVEDGRRPVVVAGTGRVEVVEDQSADPLASLAGKHLVVGMTTAVLIDAAILGVPVVSVQPGGRSVDPLPTNRRGASRLVRDPAALPGVLDGLLFSDEERRSLHEAALAFTPAGTATDKIRQVIYGMVVR